MDEVMSRADCTSLAKDRSRLRRMGHPSIAVSTLFQRVDKVPGSKELVHGRWIEVAAYKESLPSDT